MRTLCVWPDGCWCDLDELEEHEHKSDDFERVLVSESIEDIDGWLDKREYNLRNKQGDSDETSDRDDPASSSNQYCTDV